jgi:endonuclease/exonuclease/phosphatase family metal-dependent hydrolase
MGPRFTAMTLNVWNTERLDARREPLRRLLGRSPEVLCVQELRPEVMELIDAALPHHERVEDLPVGWAIEGNIWWDTRRFTERSHGAGDYGAPEPDRRLFWVRLVETVSQQELVVASVHLTWPGGGDERMTDHNPRTVQARAVAALLDGVAGDGRTLVMGDLNDPVFPPSVLRDAGFRSTWDALGTLPPPTFPAFPKGYESSRRPPFVPPATLDWQFHRGAVRPVLCEVIDQPWRGLAPSDHRPVHTLYELADEPA